MPLVLQRSSPGLGQRSFDRSRIGPTNFEDNGNTGWPQDTTCWSLDSSNEALLGSRKRRTGQELVSLIYHLFKYLLDCIYCDVWKKNFHCCKKRKKSKKNVDQSWIVSSPATRYVVASTPGAPPYLIIIRPSSFVPIFAITFINSLTHNPT